MEDFVFDGATRVVFGRGKEQEAGKEVARLGAKKVLVLYGQGSVKKSGLLDRVFRSLKTEGIQYSELGGVAPNPKVALIREGVKLGKQKGIELVLAVGGGSVIDSAKGIAVGVPYDGDVWDFSEKKVAPQKALPVGSVLTIPAAGSEASKYAVATSDDGPYPMKRDIVFVNNELIRPAFTIMNPELTFTLPPFQTACGVVDIIAHVIERYFTSVRDVELTDRLCEAVVKTVIHNAYIVMKDPTNYSARAEIMWAGSLAHNDLLGTGRAPDFASHMIEHELSAVYNMTHGAGLAIIFPAWAKHVYKHNLERFVQFATRVWNVEMNVFDPDSVAKEGIARLEQFYKDMGLPTRLSEMKIPRDRFAEMAEKSVKLGSIKKMTTDDVQKIYELAY